MAILEVRDVRYEYRNKYQTVEAVKGITAEFETGKLSAIVGTSGSGKSTLLSMLAGILVPTAGEVLYNGMPTAGIDLNRYRRECVAVIYQSFRLFPLMTATENVMVPMELRRVKARAARDRAKELLRTVGLTDAHGRRFPGMLSGGEQQRVAIARALATDARVLLADEPTGNLDVHNSDLILDILVELAHERGYCVVLVTHNLELLERCDAVYRIEDGLLAPLPDGREWARGEQPKR